MGGWGELYSLFWNVFNFAYPLPQYVINILQLWRFKVNPCFYPTYQLPKLPWIFGVFLTLLVIKIKFFLEFSCFCTFCAENDPGTTQKKWQQRFSCLEMYFGGNNHGCQEYSKNVYKYTQADRLPSTGSYTIRKPAWMCDSFKTYNIFEEIDQENGVKIAY